jgi:hypothetical protein
VELLSFAELPDARGDLDVDFKDAHTSPDAAIILGVGKRFNRFSVEGRWETSLRSLQKDLDIGGVRLRSLTGVVSVYLK